jgi:hypothetical protein
MTGCSDRILTHRRPRGAEWSARMQKVVSEFANYVWEGRKFWLIPILAALLMVGGLMVVSSSSPLSPFIYPFF